MGIVLGGGLITIKAWTEPTVAPPGGNIGAPINTSNIGQSKSGGLVINTGGAANGLIVQNGNVGIGTTSPSQKLDVVGNIRTNNQIRSDQYCDYNGGNCKSVTAMGGGLSGANISVYAVAGNIGPHEFCALRNVVDIHSTSGGNNNIKS